MMVVRTPGPMKRRRKLDKLGLFCDLGYEPQISTAEGMQRLVASLGS